MILPEQCRAARGLLGWKQSDLADRSGVGLSTIKNLESGERKTIARNIDAISRTFESAGVEFTNGGQPGVKLSMHIAGGVSSGDDYRFDCAYQGSRFTILVEKTVLEVYDIEQYPNQSKEGRLKRMAMNLAAKVLHLLGQGREPSNGIFRLSNKDFAEGYAPGVRLRKT